MNKPSRTTRVDADVKAQLERIGGTMSDAVRSLLPDPGCMTQLQGQKVISAVLKHGDPALALHAGTRATLVWQRSYRPEPHLDLGTNLVHEYEAYAFNDHWQFVRLNVTSDMIEAVFFPHSE